MKQILAVVGTRSELARLGPTLRTLRDQYATVMRPRLMHSGERSQMVWSTGALFGLLPERQHTLSEDAMTLADLSWEISNAVGHELDSRVTDLVIVQGNSMTAMLAGQQAFLRQIPLVHVDGLASQFAEAASLPQSNRRMLSALSSFRCVPDRSQAEMLRHLGYPAFEVGVTGSTAVEASRAVLANGHKGHAHEAPSHTDGKSSVFIGLRDGETSREASTELGFALATLAQEYPDLKMRLMCPIGQISKGLLSSIAGSLENLEMVSPSDYYNYLKGLAAASVILTNAEDIAEEALALSKPVVLMQPDPCSPTHDVALDIRTVPATQDSIVNAVEMAIAEQGKTNGNGERMYPSAIGDGRASLRIVRLLNNWARNRVLTAHAFEPYDGRFQSERGVQAEVSTSLMQ